MADWYPKLGTNLTLQNTGVNTYGYVGESAGDKLYFRQWDRYGVEAGLALTVSNPESYSLQTESFIGYPQSKILLLKTFDPLVIDGMRLLCNVTVATTGGELESAEVSFKIYDGEYDYTSTVDFPLQVGESMATKGIGLIQTLATVASVLGVEASRGTGSLLTVYSIDEIVDMTTATQALVTLIIEI